MAAPGPDDLVVRPLQSADLPAAEALSAAAFAFDLTDPDRAQRWHARLAHVTVTDPHGGFVAERDGRAIGVAQALRRDGLWVLALLTVAPGTQSAGAGRALLTRSLAYGDDADAGLIISSSDSRALRLYGRAGFALHPGLDALGPLDRRALPPPDPAVREAGAADLEALEAISRDVRGGSHTPELRFALHDGAVILRHGDRGFAVTLGGHGVWLLAARDEAAAVALLWSGLARCDAIDGPVVRWVTAEQGWAIEVALRAGLRLEPFGAVCLRARPGPALPFLPSGAFG